MCVECVWECDRENKERVCERKGRVCVWEREREGRMGVWDDSVCERERNVWVREKGENKRDREREKEKGESVC